MGCIRFGDNEETLPCQMVQNSLEREHLGSLVMIISWNWICHPHPSAPHGSYLEILEAPLVLRQSSLSQSRAFTQTPITPQLNSEQLEEKYHPLSVHEAQSKKLSGKLCHLHGTVREKSIIYQTKQDSNFFIIRLSTSDFISTSLREAADKAGGAEEAAAPNPIDIMLRDSALVFFPFTEVGVEYLFTDLQMVGIQEAPNPAFPSSSAPLLVWTTSSSTRVYPFHSSQVYSTLVSRGSSGSTVLVIDLGDEAEESPRASKRRKLKPAQSSSKKDLGVRFQREILRGVSYQGTITRIISPSCAIFELDHQFLLVLHHSLCSYGIRSLRVGMELRLSNVHVLFNLPCQRLHTLTQQGSPDDRLLGFATCSLSSLDLVSCPQGESDFWIQFPEAVKMTLLTRTLGAYDLLLALSLELTLRGKLAETFEGASLSVKEQDDLVVKLILKLGLDQAVSPRLPEDFRRDVLQHHRWCELTLPSTRGLPEVPTLRFLASLPAIQDFLLNHSSEEYECKFFFSDSLGFSGLYLLGILNASANGTFSISDDTHAFSIVCSEGEFPRDHVGKLVLFDSFEIVIEILGYSASAVPLHVISIKASLSQCSVIGDSVITPDTTLLDLAPQKSSLSFPLVDIVAVLEFIGPVSAKLTGHAPELWREVEIQKLVFNPKAWPHPQTLSHWTRAILLLERSNIANGCMLQEGRCYKVTRVIEKSSLDRRVEYACTPASSFIELADSNIGMVKVGSLEFHPMGFINQLAEKRNTVFNIWELFKEFSPGATASASLPLAPLVTGNTMVSFEGLIMAKGFRFSNREFTTTPEQFQQLLNNHSVGLGRPDKVLHLRIRDLSTVDTIDFFYDSAEHIFPLGLLPGRVVQLRRVVLKLSKNGHCFATMTSQTTIHTRDFEPLPVALPRPDNGRSYLISFYGRPLNPASVTIACRVNLVHFVLMKWTCSHCGRILSRDSCPRGCDALFSAPSILRTELNCSVSDGSAEATVLALGDHVFKMFELTKATITRLRALTLHYGEAKMFVTGAGRQTLFNDQVANAADDTFFQNCFDPKIVSGEYLLTCQQIKDPAEREVSEQTRTITVNQLQVSTASLPRVFLKVLRVEKADPAREGFLLLEALKTRKCK